jgi:phosphatidylglycerophosphate synthase
MTQDPNPHEALAAIRNAREGLAPPADYPIAYDLAYGAVCALLVAGQGMPRPWTFVVLPIALFGLAGLVMWWRKKFGWWISGYSPKRARWVAFGLVAVLLALMGLSLYGRFVGPGWLFLVSGGIAFVSAIVGGRLWMRVWRAELAEGPK